MTSSVCVPARIPLAIRLHNAKAKKPSDLQSVCKKISRLSSMSLKDYYALCPEAFADLQQKLGVEGDTTYSQAAAMIKDMKDQEAAEKAMWELMTPIILVRSAVKWERR